MDLGPVADAIRFQSELGLYLAGTPERLFDCLADESVDLLFWSGSGADGWTRVAQQVRRVLNERGSLVLHVEQQGPGNDNDGLSHIDALLAFCDGAQFELAQEFFWWDPDWARPDGASSSAPVHSATCLWWLTPHGFPRADNRRVVRAYSQAQENLFVRGYTAKKRPSGHDISTKFGTRNKGAIPPNLLAAPRYSAAYPAPVAWFFVRMLTDRAGPDRSADLVVEVGGGGAAAVTCEAAGRRWLSIDDDESVPTRLEDLAAQHEPAFSDTSAFQVARLGGQATIFDV